MQNEPQEKSWYRIMMDTFYSLMKKHDMPEDIANEIEAFVTTVARDQYRSGAKNGAAYVYKKYGIQRNTPFAPSSA
jgi:hypothetical protein